MASISPGSIAMLVSIEVPILPGANVRMLHVGLPRIENLSVIYLFRLSRRPIPRRTVASIRKMIFDERKKFCHPGVCITGPWREPPMETSLVEIFLLARRVDCFQRREIDDPILDAEGGDRSYYLFGHNYNMCSVLRVKHLLFSTMRQSQLVSCSRKMPHQRRRSKRWRHLCGKAPELLKA